MNITPYKIIFWDNGILATAQIRPYCSEVNLGDYSTYVQNHLAFNIPKHQISVTGVEGLLGLKSTGCAYLPLQIK